MIMEQTFKCTNCGGDKFKHVAPGTVKCAYCGHMHKSSIGIPTPPAPGTPTVSPYVDTKSKSTAGILALLIGGLGIHKFYLGQNAMGILYLVFCWTYIPAIIAFVEGIVLLTMSDDEFNRKYNM